MNNANNKFIALTYKLYVDGDHGKEMVEEAKADRPFHFISGFGFALDAFEHQVISLEKGAQFSFSLSKDEAYGDYDEQQVASLDRTIFHVNGKFDSEHIYEDAIVPLQNAEGQRFYGRVLEVGNDKVKIDMNHPLAGETLYFEGEILENRDATEDEVKKLIAHLSGKGCGGGCHHDGEGCCGGGCGNHDEEGCCGGHGDGECSCGGHCHEN